MERSLRGHEEPRVRVRLTYLCAGDHYSTRHQTTHAILPRRASHPSTLPRPILVGTETSPLTIPNPFSAGQRPRYRNPHTHTRVHGRNGQIKKMKQKTLRVTVNEYQTEITIFRQCTRRVKVGYEKH